MTDKEITALIGYCSLWWPSWKHPESVPQMVLGWRPLLTDVVADAARAALIEHATSGAEFPPPPGVIRRRAFELTRPEGKAPSTDEAWREVQNNIAQVGWTVSLGRALVWSHPAIEAVVAALGWPHLCESENAVADRAHFSKMYAERIERNLRDHAMAPDVRALLGTINGTKAIGS